MNKLQLIENPPLPAKCVICYKDWKPNEKFLDFDASLDYYGAILICTDCAKNVVDLLGYEDKSVAAELRAKLESREKVLKMLRKKVEDLENVTRIVGINRYKQSPDRDRSIPSDEGTSKTVGEDESEPANAFS